MHASHPAGLKALPPEAPQAAQELLLGDRPRKEPGEAALIDVEAHLHGHEGELLVLSQELAEDVGSAAARAADEDERRRVAERAPRRVASPPHGWRCRDLGHLVIKLAIRRLLSGRAREMVDERAAGGGEGALRGARAGGRERPEPHLAPHPEKPLKLGGLLRAD